MRACIEWADSKLNAEASSMLQQRESNRTGYIFEVSMRNNLLSTKHRPEMIKPGTKTFKIMKNQIIKIS